MRRATIFLSGMILLLLLAMLLKGELLALPKMPSAAAAGDFDTTRAMARLERILGDQRPHPVDSAANDQVRDRLIAELRSIGLQPQVTDDLVCNGSPKSRAIACARVRNVLATIGPAEGRHLLLASHYDSTPVGPGASDDGIGMATMLETASLLSRERLKRPVTFLFDEGEESGLLGARAFLERNPLADRVDALIDVEARGVSGPAIMFETNSPNGAAIGVLRRAAAHPTANSLTTDFAKLIPNSTDVEVLKERDWTILNFAVIGNETRYHSPGDTLAALDRRSVANMGQQVLAASRQLANKAPSAKGGTRLYADLLGRWLLDMPAMVGWVLLGGLLILFAWLGWRRRQGLGRAMSVVALALVASTLFAFAAQSLLGLIRSGAWWRAFPEAAGAGIYASALAASLLVMAWIARPVTTGRLRIGFWLVFLILGAAICLVAPGAAIFFLFPPTAAGLGVMAKKWLPRAEKYGAVLAWLLLFLSWAPLLHLTEMLLDYDAAWLFAPLAALILLPALIELKPCSDALPRKTLAYGLIAFALCGWIPAAVVPAYSLDRKQEFGIEYAWDDSGKEARWMVVHDGGPLPAAFRALGSFKRGVEAPWSTRKRWTVAAPPVAIEPPALEQLGLRSEKNERLVSLRLHSNGAEIVRLRFKPEARLRALIVDGRERRFGTGKADDDFFFRCNGRSCDGLRLDLRIASPQPVEALLIGARSRLPAEAHRLVEARPATAAPQYNPDSSIAVRRVRF